MRSRMSRLDEQAPITFQDVANAFSEEEWKLLHKWQKELYNTVMKDIQKALISLGPLIATSVFSLQPNQESWAIAHQDPVKKTTEYSEGDTFSTSDELFRISREEIQSLEDLRDTIKKQTDDPLHTGFSSLKSETVSRMEQGLGECVFDPHALNGGRNSPSSSSGCKVQDTVVRRKKRKVEMCQEVRYPERRADMDDARPSSRPLANMDILLVKIKHEEDSYFSEQETSHDTEICNKLSTGPPVASSVFPQVQKQDDDVSMDHRDFNGSKRICLPTCEKNMDRKKLLGNSLAFNEKTSSFKPFSIKGNAFRNSKKRVNYRSHAWARSNLEVGGDKSTQRQSDLNNPAPSSLLPRESNLEISENCNEFVGSVSSVPFLNFQPNAQQNYRPFVHNEGEKILFHKDSLMTPQQTDVEERPYQCAECKKCFKDKAALNSHIRTHTGERPHQCTDCGKSFNQKGVLIRHRVTHTGERPFPCNECEKSFTRKANLLLHQRIHTEQYKSKAEHTHFI